MTPLPESVTIDVAGLTDTGRVRDQNEDNFAIVKLRRAVKIEDTSLDRAAMPISLRELDALLLVVADGVGGQAGGELASSRAVTEVMEYLGELAGCVHSLDVHREDRFIEQLEQGVKRAHERVLVDYGGTGPATTLTLAVIVWPRAYIVHVGDSRAAYLRRGRLRRLTRDQTFAEYMLDAGAWTEEQAATSRRGGLLFSAIGSSEMTPNVGLVDLQLGDVLILCTDGLTNHVPDEKLAAHLAAERPAADIARGLIDAANADGGKDNITAIIARMRP